MSFHSYLPQNLSKKDLHQLILGSVSPRPIALVSTIDKNNIANLAPFSFFNAISSNPPLVVISVSVPEENMEKDTLINIRESNECVINIVNHTIIRQMTLCSVAYNSQVSEFDKSGLKQISSHLVRPFRVKESPVHLECTVVDILAYGKHKGAANLIICKVVKMHIMKSILLKDKIRLDSSALNVVGRLGRNQYVKVNSDNILDIYQSVIPNCIGFDGLSNAVKKSDILTGNDLAEIASCEILPSKEEVLIYIKKNSISIDKPKKFYHQLAKKQIQEKNKYGGLKCVMIPEYLNIL